MKKCANPECQESQPLSQAHFSKDASRKDGLHPYCKACASLRKRESRLRNPDKTAAKNRRNYLRRNRLIGVSGYSKLLEEQGHRCASCKIPALALERRLLVDQDKRTGRIRGLLCNDCQTIVGKARDDVGILKAAIRYLEKNK